MPDELLHRILLAAGGPAAARAATLCRRLRAAKDQLAQLPGFASAAVIGEEDVLAAVRAAVLAAREGVPPAVDVCLCFVGGTPKGRAAEQRAALAAVVPCCQALLPPGTLVVGCCGRGVFGTTGGAAVEMDPRPARSTRAASVLLGRLPGCTLRAFAADEPPAGQGDWLTEEGCRAWLGLAPHAAAAAEPEQALDPVSCLLFCHPAVGRAAQDCLEGLQAAFPGLLITGGISSGAKALFCSQLLRAAQGEQEAPTGAATQHGPRFVGLLACQRRERQACAAPGPKPASPEPAGPEPAGPSAAGAPGPTEPGMPAGAAAPGDGKYYGAGVAAQGMCGEPPLLTRIHLVRGQGVVLHDTIHGQAEEMELLGLASACTAEGLDAMPALTRLARNQQELGLWAAAAADLGSYDAAVAAGQPTVVLQLYGVVEDGEAVAVASCSAALAAVLAAAEQAGHTLCAQRLSLSSEGAKDAVQHGAAQLAGGRPACHPLLPTATMGLVLVSCTAKGREMHASDGVEAQAIYASSGGLPMAGVYCDGEIGPEITNAKSAMCWQGNRTAGSSQNSSATSGMISQRLALPRSKLQGFTTILTALGAAV